MVRIKFLCLEIGIRGVLSVSIDRIKWDNFEAVSYCLNNGVIDFLSFVISNHLYGGLR